MPYIVPIADAQAHLPQYRFIGALTPSEQKAAFHVKDHVGKDLCLKLIAPNYALDRLEREVRALQNVVHDNVAQFVEYTNSYSGGVQLHYLVEEFVDGSDLSDVRVNSQPVDLLILLPIVQLIAEGLSAMAAQNIVHRDLKPTNVRVRANGEPVIIDFGLARHLDLPDLTPTAHGARIGTPLYLSPEQCVGTKHDIDPRTDVFALGVIFYEFAVGKHPFWEPAITTEAELHEAICLSTRHEQDPAFLALPDKVKLVVGRCLAKDRGSRPGASKLAQVLQTLQVNP